MGSLVIYAKDNGTLVVMFYIGFPDHVCIYLPNIFCHVTMHYLKTHCGSVVYTSPCITSKPTVVVLSIFFVFLREGILFVMTLS